MRRWLIFNSVGALGFFVQLAVLKTLVDQMALGYLTATALAVETAVIHNFIWHERWTWADRGRPGRAGGLRRFLAFNLSNGAVSIAGNLICMRIFMSTLPVNYLVANVMAIAVCSIVNYVLSDRLVFVNSNGVGTNTGNAALVLEMAPKINDPDTGASHSKVLFGRRFAGAMPPSAKEKS